MKGESVMADGDARRCKVVVERPEMEVGKGRRGNPACGCGEM